MKYTTIIAIIPTITQTVNRPTFVIGGPLSAGIVARWA